MLSVVAAAAIGRRCSAGNKADIGSSSSSSEVVYRCLCRLPENGILRVIFSKLFSDRMLIVLYIGAEYHYSRCTNVRISTVAV